MRIATITLCVLMLSGCVTTQRQYQWGEYERMLYNGYKDPVKMDALTVTLESQLKQLEQNPAEGCARAIRGIGDALSPIRVARQGDRNVWPRARYMA